MKSFMTFGAALKKSREKAGLTQTEFSKLLGVSFYINQYENVHHEPTPIVLNAIKIFSKRRVFLSCTIERRVKHNGDRNKVSHALEEACQILAVVTAHDEMNLHKLQGKTNCG